MDIKSLAAEGLKKTQIADRLGVDRGTVAKYLALENIPPRLKRQASSLKIDPFVDHLKARLVKYPELTAERLYREIVELGYSGSRRTVRRFVANTRPHRERVYKPFETLPGEQAQVDWGHFDTIEIDGQKLHLYAFVFVLSYSRMRYVEFTTSQDMATFLACHGRAITYSGGCPHEVIYDNAKTVTLERVGSVVRFHPDLLRYAAAYGFRARACWVRDPESKGKVESTVKYVRQDFFYAAEFSGLENLNRQARTWYNEVANQKISATTGEVPAERLVAERQFLLPLPTKAVEMPAEDTARVTKTCLVSWGSNQYSVPHRLARKLVKLHIYEDRLDVFLADEKVVTLPRCRGKGQRIIVDEHYEGRNPGPSGKGSTLQQRFEVIGKVAPAYLRGVAKSQTGHLREQAESILGLCETYGASVVHQAMERAASFGAFSYGVLKRILEKQQRAPQALPERPPEGVPVTVAAPAIVVQQRSLDYYARAGRG